MFCQLKAVFKKLVERHTNFVSKFSSTKLTNVGTYVGAVSGFIYLNEYYSKVAFNAAAMEWNNLNKTTHTIPAIVSPNSSKETLNFGLFSIEIDASNGNGITNVSFSANQLATYDNVFSIVIMPCAPYSINFATTTITGALLYRLATRYIIVTLPLTIAYNLANHTRSK